MTSSAVYGDASTARVMATIVASSLKHGITTDNRRSASTSRASLTIRRGCADPAGCGAGSPAGGRARPPPARRPTSRDRCTRSPTVCSPSRRVNVPGTGAGNAVGAGSAVGAGTSGTTAPGASRALLHRRAHGELVRAGEVGDGLAHHEHGVLPHLVAPVGEGVDQLEAQVRRQRAHAVGVVAPAVEREAVLVAARRCDQHRDAARLEHPGDLERRCPEVLDVLERLTGDDHVDRVARDLTASRTRRPPAR